MPDETRPHAEGVIILDRSGRIAFASGVGTNERLQAIATDPKKRAEAETRRLISVNVEGERLAIVALPYADGMILAISKIPDAVFEFISAVDFAYDIVRHLVSDPFDAMTVVDSEARITFISPVHESFFGMDHGEAIGKPVNRVIENTALDRVVKSGKAEVGKLQRMRGSERVVSRVPILRNGHVVGAVGRVMFKGPEQLEALSRRLHILEREVEFYRREAKALRQRSYRIDSIIGESPAIQRLKSEIAKVAPLDVSVLIRGESGTGKELIAQALHGLSQRREGPYIPVNAAALPANLVESELFGYEAGSFTGADRKGRKGKFELAAAGTIFLDEIGDMPLEVQAKLLRVLQDRLVERVGGNQAREVDFGLIAATNRDLQTLVRDEKFRLDLYYRISPIVLEVPALRQRLEDIPLLVSHFLREFCERHRRPVPDVAPEAFDRLYAMSWPGNVRQLRHEVERAAIFAEGNRIERDDFNRYNDLIVLPQSPVSAPFKMSANTRETLQEAVERMEDELIRDAMKRNAGNKKRVAEELGISRSYLYKRLGLVQAESTDPH
jgi:PAS domain S-box-containing protein